MRSFQNLPEDSNFCSPSLWIRFYRAIADVVGGEPLEDFIYRLAEFSIKLPLSQGHLSLPHPDPPL
jgi:hypothetical protein